MNCTKHNTTKKSVTEASIITNPTESGLTNVDPYLNKQSLLTWYILTIKSRLQSLNKFAGI
jgi:hypothetical protein